MHSWLFVRGQRVYLLTLGPCLLGEFAILRKHGRRGLWWRDLPPLVYPDEPSARRAMARQIRRRRKRGYRRDIPVWETARETKIRTSDRLIWRT